MCSVIGMNEADDTTGRPSQQGLSHQGNQPSAGRPQGSPLLCLCQRSGLPGPSIVEAMACPRLAVC
jgi:hypothetical protein